MGWVWLGACLCVCTWTDGDGRCQSKPSRLYRHKHEVWRDENERDNLPKVWLLFHCRGPVRSPEAACGGAIYRFDLVYGRVLKLSSLQTLPPGEEAGRDVRLDREEARLPRLPPYVYYTYMYTSSGAGMARHTHARACSTWGTHLHHQPACMPPIPIPYPYSLLHDRTGNPDPYRDPLDRVFDWGEIKTDEGHDEVERKVQAARCMDCGT